MDVIVDHRSCWQERRIEIISDQCVYCIRKDMRKWQITDDCLTMNLPDGLQTVTIKLLCDGLIILLYIH